MSGDGSPRTVRPIVRRTYGRTREQLSPPVFGLSALSQINPPSSSPRSAFRLETPPSSPPAKRARFDNGTKDNTRRYRIDQKSDDVPLASSSSPVKGAVGRPFATTTSASRQGSLKAFFFTAEPKNREPLRPRSVNPVSSISTLDRATEQKSSSRQSVLPAASSSATPGNHIPPKIQHKALQQSHLTHLPLLHTCRTCCMTYVRGGADESLHAKHHGRVVKGIPWEGLGRGGSRASAGREIEKRAKADMGWREVDQVRFGIKGECSGRILVCDGSWGGSKLEEILQTVDLSLSSPPLPSSILDHCRILLLVTSSPPPLRPGTKLKLNISEGKKASSGERIVAVVVAQGIKWAMNVISSEDKLDEGKRGVDSGGGVICE